MIIHKFVAHSFYSSVSTLHSRSAFVWWRLWPFLFLLIPPLSPLFAKIIIKNHNNKKRENENKALGCGVKNKKNDEILFNEYLFFRDFHPHIHAPKNYIFFIVFSLSTATQCWTIFLWKRDSMKERWEYYEYKILCNHTLCFLLLFLALLYEFLLGLALGKKHKNLTYKKFKSMLQNKFSLKSFQFEVRNFKFMAFKMLEIFNECPPAFTFSSDRETSKKAHPNLLNLRRVESTAHHLFIVLAFHCGILLL